MQASDVRSRQSKTLSVGITTLPSISSSTVTTYAERMERVAANAAEVKEKARLQREQMELAKTPIPINRRPYARTVHGNDENKGLVIGDQRDPEKCFADKKHLQQSYKEQLRSDIERNSIPITRPASMVKTSKYNAILEDRAVYGGFMVGKDADVQKEEKRIAAAVLMNQALLDIGDKNEVKTLRQQQEEKSKEGEDATSGLLIGSDEESARAAQKKSQRLYYAQLVADKRSQPIDPHQMLKEHIEDDDIQYLNRTGWTGLQIGGQSSDATRSMQYLHATQKIAKQLEYRQALHDQQALHAQIEREVIYPVIGDFSAKSVPYMR